MGSNPFEIKRQKKSENLEVWYPIRQSGDQILQTSRRKAGAK